jgi:hypothetical protein
MALWSRALRAAGLTVTNDALTSQEMVLTDVLSRYDVVEVIPAGEGHEPYMLVTDRTGSGYNDGAVTFAETAAVDFSELGTSDPSPFTSFTREEYNSKLRGVNGLKIYDQMRKSDGAVIGALRTIKTPVLGARWFVEAASDSKKDQEIAEFVWRCLTEYQSIAWTQILTEALLQIDFGYYMFEKVFDVRIIKGKPRIVWGKLAPRHPMDVKQWHKDSHGGPAAVEMYGIPGDQFGLYASNDVKIPIDKLLVFSYQREAGNIQGVSGLRQAYKHWFYKDQLYKIDAIQKERHGIGIPVIKLPVGFSNGDKMAADELGRNLRTNERAHVVLPPNWDLLFAKMEGHPVNAMESIEHHDARIRESILAKFVGDNVTTQKEDLALFLKATKHLADGVCDTFNLYAIPQLVDFNFPRTPNGYPKLRARNIGEYEDQRTFSFTIRNLVGAGLITPDERLESYLRQFLDLPRADEETRREVATPQDPNEVEEEEEDDKNKKQSGARVGMPRQTPKARVGLARGNAGTDRSGGTR